MLNGCTPISNGTTLSSLEFAKTLSEGLSQTTTNIIASVLQISPRILLMSQRELCHQRENSIKKNTTNYSLQQEYITNSLILSEPEDDTEFINITTNKSPLHYQNSNIYNYDNTNYFCNFMKKDSINTSPNGSIYSLPYSAEVSPDFVLKKQYLASPTIMPNMLCLINCCPLTKNK